MSILDANQLCFNDRTYIIFACFCFSMGVFVWFFIPETKGMKQSRCASLQMLGIITNGMLKECPWKRWTIFSASPSLSDKKRMLSTEIMQRMQMLIQTRHLEPTSSEHHKMAEMCEGLDLTEYSNVGTLSALGEVNRIII